MFLSYRGSHGCLSTGTPEVKELSESLRALWPAGWLCVERRTDLKIDRHKKSFSPFQIYFQLLILYRVGELWLSHQALWWEKSFVPQSVPSELLL